LAEAVGRAFLNQVGGLKGKKRQAAPALARISPEVFALQGSLF
jgi:hypothetical protein